MKRNLFLYLYGAIIIFEGVFLVFSNHFTFHTTKYTLGIILITGAIIALMTAFTSQRKQVEFAYHEVHALAMFVYGVSVLLFVNDLDILSYLTAFLLFFYSISEIIFCSWLFNLANKVKFQILLIRVILGLAVGIGTVVFMNYFAINKTMVMQGFGILVAIIGINVMLYIPIMTTKTINE